MILQITVLHLVIQLGVTLVMTVLRLKLVSTGIVPVVIVVVIQFVVMVTAMLAKIILTAQVIVTHLLLVKILNVHLP
jgi:hypothetical protein